MAGNNQQLRLGGSQHWIMLLLIESKKPFDIYEGSVGPQIDGRTYLSGGGTQITFKDNDAWSNARPNKYNGKTKDPYLDVVSIKPLPPES